MPYQMSIGGKNRGLILVLVDQSYSMASAFGGTKSTLADETARAVNGVIRDLALACTSGDTIKDRLDVGAIGYGGSVESILTKFPKDRPTSIRDLAHAPARVETVKRKLPDGAGGVIEVDYVMPIWVEPEAHNGTPMAEAFDLARNWATGWCATNARSFPPVVVNITDADPTDMKKARESATRLRKVATDDGHLLLFNIHVSASHSTTIVTPNDVNMLPDEFSRFLFEISSEIPASLLGGASREGLSALTGARGFVANADASHMISLLRFGTVGTLTTMGIVRET